ncbi:MAG: hypothetical protein RKP73_08330 [Candidatus Contendobacter sp.]|nr:hypothetical protein [Candidatus Contendobacter sp.]
MSEKNAVFVGFIGFMLTISVSTSVADSNLNRQGENRLRSSSLYEIKGVSNPPTGKFVDQSFDKNMMTQGVATPLALPAQTNPLLIESTLSRQFYYASPPNGGCVDIPKYPSFATIYDASITTQNLSSSNTNLVEIIYDGQMAIAQGGTVSYPDSVYFKCTVIQGVDTTPCSNTQYLPAMLRQGQSPNEAPNMVMVSYAGYAVVDNGTSTTVKIELTTEFSTATACYNNLILRTR